MRTECSLQEWRFAELVDAVPLNPIEDECSYTRAMQLLDRLFVLERQQNHEEIAYFRALAQIVYEYESRATKSPRQTTQLDRIDHLDHRLEPERLQSQKGRRHTQCGRS
jgi:hypothetical protein